MSLKIILFLAFVYYVDNFCSADPTCTSVIQNDCTSLAGEPRDFCELQGTWYIQAINLPPNSFRCGFYTFSTTEDGLQYMVSTGYYNGANKPTSYVYRVIRNYDGRLEYIEFPTPTFVGNTVVAAFTADGFALVGCILTENAAATAITVFTRLANPPQSVVTALMAQLAIKEVVITGVHSVNQTVCYKL